MSPVMVAVLALVVSAATALRVMVPESVAVVNLIMNRLDLTRTTAAVLLLLACVSGCDDSGTAPTAPTTDPLACLPDCGGADMRDANLTRADLRGVNLTEADLRGADLRGVDLSNARCRWTDLGDADLRGANLSGANLYGATLTGADLTGADLTGADLTYANLRGATLTGARLDGADLTGVIGFDGCARRGCRGA